MRIRCPAPALGPPPQPDPTTSVLPSYYGPPYSRFFPLLRPSGGLGVVSRGAAGRMVPTEGPTDPYGTPLGPVSLTEQMPWLYAPLEALPFVLIPAAPIGGLANGSSAIVVALPQLPRGRGAVLQRFGNNASVLAGVTWSFLVRGQPTAPIINFPSQYGLPTDPRPLPNPGTILHSGDDFQLQVTNNSGGVLNQITAIVLGYQWTLRA
jgi:hypothetical protein